ncbi:hypothetical protein AAC387_Pa12g1662 [Persea americana]
MAELLLSPLLKVVFEKLVSLITEEHRLQRGVHKEMERLRSTVTTIQAVLEDAEEQQVKDKAVKHCWRNAEQVLEGLEPHPSIKRLLVDEYAEDVNLCPHLANCLSSRSSRFAEWMLLNVLTMSPVDSHR